MADEDGKPPAVMMDGVPFYIAARPADEITTVIDIGDYAEAKLRGIRCHATQIGRSNRFSDTPDEVMREHWFRHEHFVLARSSVGWPQGVETDLFAGLR
jgi:LmbE family N-acetylglucosaminyl deacetylase